MDLNQIKNIYNEIAHDFDKSRVRIWPHVSNFLSGFQPGSKMLDLGCGNGKNMLYRTDLDFYGLDISQELVNICNQKKLKVIEGSMTFIPFSDNLFDGIITIASYHHLSNDEDRQKTLSEIYRTLKPNGRALITVWAMEQLEDSTFHFTQVDEMVKWTNTKTKKTFYRYYHIYRENDLSNEIQRLNPNFNIQEVGYEKGNWFIILTKS